MKSTMTRHRIGRYHDRYCVQISDSSERRNAVLKIGFKNSKYDYCTVVDTSSFENIHIDSDISLMQEDELFQMSLIYNYDMEVIKNAINYAKHVESTGDTQWYNRVVEL